jgi:DHA1 family bicyclomycin/chloramphenicol resistance-like MFS transporter
MLRAGTFARTALLAALSAIGRQPVLIGARFLQAFGGCGGIVLARAVVRDLYSGACAGRELSLIGSVMALAPGSRKVGIGFRIG